MGIDEKSLEYLQRCGVEITPSLITKIKKHKTMYHLESSEICAYYSDLNDFLDEWTSLGYKRTEARKLLHGGQGEFMTLNTGEILRFAL
jgi:hypothetical protein